MNWHLRWLFSPRSAWNHTTTKHPSTYRPNPIATVLTPHHKISNSADSYHGKRDDTLSDIEISQNSTICQRPKSAQISFRGCLPFCIPQIEQSLNDQAKEHHHYQLPNQTLFAETAPWRSPTSLPSN